LGGGGHNTMNKRTQTFGKTVHLFCDRDQRWNNKHLFLSEFDTGT